MRLQHTMVEKKAGSSLSPFTVSFGKSKKTTTVKYKQKAVMYDLPG